MSLTDNPHLKSEEKIKKLYEELLESDVEEASKTDEEKCVLKGESSKQIMGAV